MMNQKYENQKGFWEYAGKIGYNSAMFANEPVAKHVKCKEWETVMHAAKQLDLHKDARVLELGSGDGVFSTCYLSPNFKQVDAYEISKAAVKRAQNECKQDNVKFKVADVTKLEYSLDDFWDGVFLISFLHHAKNFTPTIISRLSKVTSRVIVVEPNGDNILRKGLELLPSYKAAGEDSFRLNQLARIFKDNGFSLQYKKNINIVPLFCPQSLLPFLQQLEKIIEPNDSLNPLCTAYVMGFQKD